CTANPGSRQARDVVYVPRRTALLPGIPRRVAIHVRGDVQQEGVMRTTILLAVILVASALVAAQESDEYTNPKDGFKIYFPAAPTVKDITWVSQQNFKLPGRVYSVDKGKEHYSVTVVDYTGIEQMGIERAKGCPPRANVCTGNDLGGLGFWK